MKLCWSGEEGFLGNSFFHDLKLELYKGIRSKTSEFRNNSFCFLDNYSKKLGEKITCGI